MANDAVKSAGETYLFIEKVTRSLETLEGKRYSEICLLREIGFFEEALTMSKSLIESFGEDRGKELDTVLRAAWSLPGGARVLVMGEIDAFRLGGNLNRFSSAVNVIEEFARLVRTFKYLERKSVDFRIPPVCRLGEIIYRYVNPSPVE